MTKKSYIQPTPEMIDAFVRASNTVDPWKFIPEATLLYLDQKPTHTTARLVSAWDEVRVIWPATDTTLPLMIAETAHSAGTLRTLGATGVERVFNGRWQTEEGGAPKFDGSLVNVDDQSAIRVAEERERLGRLLESVTRAFV